MFMGLMDSHETANSKIEQISSFKVDSIDDNSVNNLSHAQNQELLQINSSTAHQLLNASYAEIVTSQGNKNRVQHCRTLDLDSITAAPCGTQRTKLSSSVESSVA